MVCRWLGAKKKEIKKAGRKVNSDFEAAVISKLFITQITKDGSIEILANAAFSYGCFKHAAALVRSNPEFEKCPIVQRLHLSNCWVHGLKKRYELRKRRCTTIMKPKQSLETIVEFYRDFHETVKLKEVKPELIFNEDETAIFCCPELLHQYINKTAQRAVSPFGGDEGRFTALLGSSSTGNMLPLMVFSSLQQFRAELLQWSVAVVDNPNLPKPKFEPPKPTYKDAVRTMLEVHKVKLSTEQFQCSLSECFKKVALVPQAAGEYTKYRPVKLGVVKKEGLNNGDSIAGWCIDITTRRDEPDEDPEFDVPSTAPALTTPQETPQLVPVIDIDSDTCSNSSSSDDELDDSAMLDIIADEEAPPSATVVSQLISTLQPVDFETEGRGKRVHKLYNKHANWEK